MFDHPIIDVALGLIFFYVVLSLVASAVQEWIASFFGLRSHNLNSGIKQLVSDQYAQKVYNHPLIKNLANKNKRLPFNKLPSHIAPGTLSSVLLEVVAKDNGDKSYVACTADEIRDAIDKIDEGHPLRDILQALVTDGQDAADALKDKLADWFDEGMTRISGWYTRWVKVAIIIIATVVTVAVNASSIHMAEKLWKNDALRTVVAAQAQAAGTQVDIDKFKTDNLGKLEAFPIGWENIPDGGVDWLKTLLGWLITIAAISLGAPFWFDLLGKVANLKGSGGKAQVRKKT